MTGPDARPDVAEPRQLRGPHAPERLRSYRAVAAVYTVVVGAGLMSVRGRDAGPERPSAAWSDILLVALATQKMSRLVSKQTVAAPLRAPFTADEGAAGPGERNARPIGTGWRRSVGELVSCPFCLDVWLGSGHPIG